MLYLRKGFVLRIRVQTHSKSFFLHKDTHPRWQGFYVFWQHIPGKEVQLMSNSCPPRKFLWWIILKCIQTIRLDSTESWRRHYKKLSYEWIGLEFWFVHNWSGPKKEIVTQSPFIFFDLGIYQVGISYIWLQILFDYHQINTIIGGKEWESSIPLFSDS